MLPLVNLYQEDWICIDLYKQGQSIEREAVSPAFGQHKCRLFIIEPHLPHALRSSPVRWEDGQPMYGALFITPGDGAAGVIPGPLTDSLCLGHCRDLALFLTQR